VGAVRERVKPFERDRLLERIDREGATIGASIPERLSIDGDPIDLQSFVHEAKRADGPPERRIQAVVRGLRGERRRRRERIESGDLTREEGEDLADSILGIDRALTVLEADGDTDIEAESEKRRQADRKRWLSFVKSVTGDESGRHAEGKR
jgi:hypothetical protein